MCWTLLQHWQHIVSQNYSVRDVFENQLDALVSVVVSWWTNVQTLELSFDFNILSM